MKHTSKLAYLLGLPVLVGVFALCTVNVVNGNVSITIPLWQNLHRSQLQSLVLGMADTGASIAIDVSDNSSLNVSKGLLMGQNNGAAVGASFVSIGGGKGNYIDSVENSGIGGGNNNKIYSSSCVIGGGSGNTVSGNVSQGSAIAGGLSNVTQLGGIVVGGAENKAMGTGVIVGGQNNSFDGDGSLIFGSNSWGGKGSFSWNSSIIQNYSAVIMASGGALIGTYDTVSGVNLVVAGAVKIGADALEGIAGEIKMQSGCFYAYDGDRWYVINRGLGNECINASISCYLGGVERQPGESVSVYVSPVSLNCSLDKVDLTCRDNGTFGCSGDACLADITFRGEEYYYTCHDIGDPECGSANGQTYTETPVQGLCVHGNSSAVEESDTTYTWSCDNWGDSVSCSATKVYNCGGSRPTGAGLRLGSQSYAYGYSPTSWTYVSGQPGVCQWTCEAGYLRVDGKNECVRNDGGVVENPECGSAAGQIYTSAPTEGLCNIGIDQNLHEQNTAYTWYCVNGDKSVTCSATRDRTIFGCISTDQMMNNVDTVVQVSEPSPNEDVEKKLYASSSEVPEGQYCAYICNENGGWHFFPAGVVNGVLKQKRCAKCVQGTEIYENGVLVSCTELIDVCPRNYYYKAETNQCVAYGNCLWNGSIRHSLEHTVNVTNSDDLKLARPIGRNMEWTWKLNLDDVEYNQCNFVCESGYISRAIEDYKYGCVEPFCGDGTSSIRRSKANAVMSENPMSYNQIHYVSGGRRYEKYWEYVENITSEDAFYEWVADKNGCYFWCPEDRLCKRDMGSNTHAITTDSRKWTCYATSGQRDELCVEKAYTPPSGGGNSLKCNGYSFTLKGYASASNYAYGQNRDFQTYATPGGYEAHSSEGCLQGCTNDATGVITGPNGETVCWKQCPAYQYFSLNGGGCVSCPNNLQKPNPDNMFHGNSLGGCVPKCGEGQTLCQDCGTNGGEACIQTVINLNTECDTGGVLQFDQSLQQFRCVYDVYVYD